jgi:hypothetical protein
MRSFPIYFLLTAITSFRPKLIKSNPYLLKSQACKNIAGDGPNLKDISQKNTFPQKLGKNSKSTRSNYHK